MTTRFKLAAAVGVLSATPLMAADLPARKAAPVEYVRVCSTYGAGFFYIPGTDTCIRVGGRIRYEFQMQTPYTRNDDQTGTRGLGRIYADARTATEYGLLRAFVRLDVARRNGAIYSGTAARIGTAFTGSSVDYNGAAQTQVVLDRAFIQFGGLTAGRSQSFFGFYQGDLEWVGITAGQSSLNDLTNLLAYTATLGSGFSATVAIEDPVEARNAIATAVTPAPGLVPTYAYTGSGAPDLVALLRYDGSWGAAQLSGALHQVRVGEQTALANGVTPQGFAPSTEYGYALNAGVKFNLPMIASGDALYLQGTYTHGASSYIMGNYFGLGKAAGWGIGGVGNLGMPDAVVAGAAPGDLKLTNIGGVTAAALHYWAPTVRQSLFATYMSIDFGGGAYYAANGFSLAYNGTNPYRDWRYWGIGSNLIWSPVANLDIGAELNYVRAEAGQGGVYSTVSTDPRNWVRKSGDQVIARFRIQRDF
ncbi:porin [Alsobacter sp. SYSU BS001988]